MSADWFRNSTWSVSIEQAFDEKIRRARRKEQYLRIQASTLARSHPDIALKLLDRYFELPNDFDHAQAHVDRATAYLALGRVADALSAYEDALARESVFPNLKTEAYVAFPYLVAARGIREHYSRALQLLLLHKSRLMFPVDHFRWHTARALIASAAGEADTAKVHSQQALDAAALEHSGFRYHPSVGLVTDQYGATIKRLEALRAA
jgi:tetratricopeptide (TPR) repeat protein